MLTNLDWIGGGVGVQLGACACVCQWAWLNTKQLQLILR